MCGKGNGEGNGQGLLQEIVCAKRLEGGGRETENRTHLNGNAFKIN